MADIDAYAKAAGHPPSAARRVLIDFDRVIRPWGDLISWEPPYPGAIEAIKKLREWGYEVVIFTSRASVTWHRAEAERRKCRVTKFGDEQMDYVRTYLARYGVWDILITAEKLPALVLFDDSAVVVSDKHPLAKAVDAWLAARP